MRPATYLVGHTTMNMQGLTDYLSATNQMDRT